MSSKNKENIAAKRTVHSKFELLIETSDDLTVGNPKQDCLLESVYIGNHPTV